VCLVRRQIGWNQSSGLVHALPRSPGAQKDKGPLIVVFGSIADDRDSVDQNDGLAKVHSRAGVCGREARGLCNDIWSVVRRQLITINQAATKRRGYVLVCGHEHGPSGTCNRVSKVTAVER